MVFKLVHLLKMFKNILFVIFCILPNAHCITKIPETTNTMFSFINTPMTWNEAVVECQTRGGRPINIYDEVRKIASSIYVKYLVDATFLTTDFWIGLHDVNGSDSSGIFKWSDCSDITTSYWSNTTQAAGENCVSAQTNDNLSWKIRPCSDKLYAICETLDHCSCEIVADGSQCANLHTTVSSEFIGYTEDECKIKCLMHVRSNEQCWALSYNRTSSTCIIHERLQTTTSCTSELIFYSKVCFKYTTPIPRINVTYVNNDLIPDTSCTVDDNVVITANDCNYTLPTITTTTESTRTCSCSSTKSGLPDFWGNSTLKQQIEWLVTNLKVDKQNTSLMRRRKFSADDSRMTAKSIGYAGTAILILVVSGIIILDLSRLGMDISHALKEIQLSLKK